MQSNNLNPLNTVLFFLKLREKICEIITYEERTIFFIFFYLFFFII